MHDIEMHEFTQEFARCWSMAGKHLNSQVEGGIQSWLRVDLCPPFLEHLSFRLGNQLFFVRVEDVNDKLPVPGTLKGLLTIAEGCNGHACVMLMDKKFENGPWATVRPGWGLIDARTRAAIDPTTLITEEKIEMTDWELHDFAVQIVRQQLEKDGRQLMSWQGNPQVDPSIWFVGDKGPEWVVVRVTRCPGQDAVRPKNWDGIAASCARLSNTGHFAPVSFTSFGFTDKGAPDKLWRGEAANVRYLGLNPA